MATGTTNPPGSDHPLDLRADAKNLDLLLLAPNDSYPDRLGVPKRSWAGINSAYDAAEDDRYAQFQAQLATMGYELPSLPYAAGLAIVRETQLIERLGEFYRAKAGVVPFVTTGVWATDELNLVAVGDAVLRQELAADDGAEQVGTIAPGAGAVPSTVAAELNREFHVEQYGAVPGYLVTNNGPAFRACMAAARAAGKSEIHAKGWMYLFQDELMETLDSMDIILGGRDDWDSKGANRPRKMEKGTTLLMCGTPTNRVTVDNVSNMMVAGGVILNDDYATEGFAGNEYYSLLNFTNNDSVDNNPATKKQLKVGWLLGNYSRLKNGRVQLNYDGVNGYNSVESLSAFPEYTVSYPGLGDDYDIGVMSKNVMYSGVHDMQVVGYWRMAARAVIASNYGDGASFAGCIVADTGDNFFQGYNGYVVRGNDVHRVTALTTTTAEVPWNSSHTVPTSGMCYLGGRPYAYTSTAKVGDKIVLSGFTIDPSTKTSVGAECFFGTNIGFSGSVAEGTVTGLGHFTNRRAYDPYLTTPFPNPSKAMEMSGAPLRDFDTTGLRLFDTDVAYFGHDVLQPSFLQAYAEAQGYAGGIVGQDKGARMILSARPDLADAHGLYPAGNCSGITWDATSEMSDGSIDMYPMYRSTSPTRRFNGTTKYCMPDDALFNQIGYWPQRWGTRRRYDHGPRLWTDGPSNDLSVVDSTLSYQQYWDAANKRIGFGTNNPQADLHRIGATANLRLEANVAGVDPTLQLATTARTYTLRPQESSIGQLQVRVGSTVLVQVNPTNGTFWPGTHNLSTNGTVGAQWADVLSVKGTFSGPVKPGQFTLATLPSAAAFNGYEIDVTDATGGSKRCRSNGTVWQILNTTTTVS